MFPFAEFEILLPFLGIALAVAALLRNRSLEERIAKLERRGRARDGEKTVAALPVGAPPALVAPAPTRVAPRPAAPAEGPRSVRGSGRAVPFDLESLIGRRFMAIAGALVFLVGVGFFLKYAYDAGWIGPAGRLAIGACAGAVFLVGGSLPRTRELGRFADLVTGLGLAIWYLCIWFAFEVWGLWGAPFAFGAAVLVTLLAILLAAHRSSIGLMALALAAGHLAPVLLASGENRPLVLFGWIALLAAAGLGVASWRGWTALGLPLLLAGAALYLGWYAEHWGPDELGRATGFLVLMTAIYALMPRLEALVRRGEVPGGQQVVSLAGLALALFASHRHLLDEPRLAGLVTAAAGLFLLGPLVLVGRRGEPGRTLLAGGIAFVAAGLAVVAGLPLPPILAAAVLLAAIDGARRAPGREILAIFGVAAAGAALAGALAVQPAGLEVAPFFRHPAFLSWFVVVAALILASAFARRDPADRLAGYAPILVLFGLLAGGLAWHLEIVRWWAARGAAGGLPAHADLHLTILVWSIISVVSSVAARRLGWSVLKGLAIVPFLVAFGLAFAGIDAFLAPDAGPELLILNPRVLSGFALAACLFVASWALGGEPGRKAGRGLRAAAALAGALLVAVGLHLDLAVYFAARGGDPLARMRCWLVLWSLCAGIPAVLHRRGFVVPRALLGAFQATGLLMALAAVAGPFAAERLPVLGLDLGLRFTLLALVVLGALDRRGRPGRGFALVVVIAAQLVLAATLALDVDGWSRHSAAVLPFLGPVDHRLGGGLISAIWSAQALALTLAGFRTGSKALRVTGLVFFGIVLAKVLLVDTSALPRVHRILSFVVTGLLMLLGSRIYQKTARREAGERPLAS